MTSPDIVTRAEQACAQLAQDGQPVTFTAVAALAQISRATLYRDTALRALVAEHRRRAPRPPPRRTTTPAHPPGTPSRNRSVSSSHINRPTQKPKIISRLKQRQCPVDRKS